MLSQCKGLLNILGVNNMTEEGLEVKPEDVAKWLEDRVLHEENLDRLKGYETGVKQRTQLPNEFKDYLLEVINDRIAYLQNI